MIYQETLRMLKKAASDPYTIDAPTGHSPMDYMTRYWLNNDPKIVDQRNRLNNLRTKDNAARNNGATVRANINEKAADQAAGLYKAQGDRISPRQTYSVINNARNRYSNDYDDLMRADYHINRATGWSAPSAMRDMLLMRQNPRHGLNYFNTVTNRMYNDDDQAHLRQMSYGK